MRTQCRTGDVERATRNLIHLDAAIAGLTSIRVDRSRPFAMIRTTRIAVCRSSSFSGRASYTSSAGL